MQPKRLRGSRWLPWILAYGLVVAAPLFVMLVGPRPEGRPFLRDFSVAIAFSAMSVIGLQFVLTARIPSLKRPFGSDVVYYFHHQISVVAVALVLLHVLVLALDDGATWNLLAFWAAPIRARFAVASLVCLLALVLVSMFRKQLKLEYITWRITHGFLAMGAAAFAMTHMQLVGIYLALPWKRILWAIYSALWIGALAYARVVRPILMKLRPYQIESIREERGSAWTIKLSPVGHGGARFSPGQFAWITVARSPFADLEHPFSYSSSAQNPRAPSFTIKAIGDFTDKIAALDVGTRVYVDGPFGAFSMDRQPSAREFVYVAGGIGITPMMSMLRTMRDRADTRPCTLFYAAQSVDEMTFREELLDLREHLNLTLHLVPAVADDRWEGLRGRIGREMLATLLPPSCKSGEGEIYVCGPPPMMDAVERFLLEMGVPPKRIHMERFNLA
ncbi:ferric reductase-like transmembrane domain-containing protein [Candidatus Bipolaricaulota bacterium]|nr:ferric reductase-like transmembrane domain-containing protein [Candidatus Bipolaricaulota bacterium]